MGWNGGALAICRARCRCGSRLDQASIRKPAIFHGVKSMPVAVSSGWNG